MVVITAFVGCEPVVELVLVNGGLEDTGLLVYELYLDEGRIHVGILQRFHVA